MDGLRYILSEIEARRYLLHGFMKGMETSKEFALFSGDVPDFIKDGELIYRPNTKSEPYRNLTVEDFNSLYKEKFMDWQEWSRLLIPLNPSKPQPANYEFKELLVCEFGGEYCQASLYMWLINPYLRQNDRKFYLIVEHRRTPRPGISYVKNGREWTYPGGFEIGDSDLEKFLIETHPYTRWEKDARTARPRTNPTEIRAECGGQAVVYEENRIFTAPIILIDEDTIEEQIRGQLLFYAWGSGYFNSLEETEAYAELRRYFKPEVLYKLIEYFQKHTFSPYNAKSNLAYLRRLSRLYKKEYELEELGGSLYFLPGGNTEENGDNLSKVIPRYLPKSIPWAHQETGIPIRTIYHLVREGKLKKAADSSENGTDAGDIIILSDDAIEKLKQRKRRKDISQLAEMKGKSREAIKKWMQRHRDLPEDKFNKKLSLWLGVRQLQSSKGSIDGVNH